MLKNKIKKIFKIPFIIILSILLFFAIRTLAFKVFICPNWLTQSSDNISEVHVSLPFLDFEITDQKMVTKLYDLCKKTKIKKLDFDQSERTANLSDCFSVHFIYKDNSSDIIDCKLNAAVLKQPANALFWTRGETNEELLSLLLEIENSYGPQIIKKEQKQIFTDIEECLKEYEQDFNKIISLAQADKSGQKESGHISLHSNFLGSNDSELEEHCLSLMKKTKVESISFDEHHVSFEYESQPAYYTSILYKYDDDEEEEESLECIVKRIKPFYYIKCKSYHLNIHLIKE